MDELKQAAEALTQILDLHLFQIKGIDITVATVVIFVVSLAVSVLVGRIVKRVLLKLMLRRHDQVAEGSAYSVARIAQYIVTLAGVFVALENVGISLGTLAALGAVFAVGLGFGLQTIAQNFVSGIILLVERPVAKGDVVVIDGTYGIVDEIAIRATRVMTFDQIAMIVPNSKLVSEVVENRSEPNTVYRTRIDVGVAYGSNTRDVERILLEVAGSHERVLNDPGPVVFFLEFGSSSLDFELGIWLDDPRAALGISTEIRHRIIKAFEREGIRIPFPQRDVHVKSLPEGQQPGLAAGQKTRSQPSRA